MLEESRRLSRLTTGGSTAAVNKAALGLGIGLGLRDRDGERRDLERDLDRRDGSLLLKQKFNYQIHYQLF